MAERLSAYDKRQISTASDFARRWAYSIVLAAAVGLAYFLAASFSVRLSLKPEGVAVFWPAAGISAGLLIALGQHARWPVLAGVIGATVATHLMIKDPLWAGVALGLCNGAEALIAAVLIHHYSARVSTSIGYATLLAYSPQQSPRLLCQESGAQLPMG
jgi:integral membrane sensor domain MASE1